MTLTCVQGFGTDLKARAMKADGRVVEIHKQEWLGREPKYLDKIVADLDEHGVIVTARVEE
jgi:hypothetical protein